MIDFHTHVYPDKIASKTVAKLASAARLFPAADGTAEGLRRATAEKGLELSVILPVATNPLPQKVAHLNEFAAWFDGSDGLLSLGSIHPDCPDWKTELSRIKCLGLKGIKLHPVYQGVPLNDIRYLRIIDEAAAIGLLVITHMGYDIGIPGVENCTPQMAADVIREVGDFPFVLAHMGGWKQWDQVMELLPGTGCYLDTSFSLGSIRLDQSTPLQDAAPDYMRQDELAFLAVEAFKKMVAAFGADHIVFGSDSPWDDPLREAQFIRSAGLSEEEQELIFSGNAKRLLNS